MLRPITEVRHRLPDRRAVELGETPRHTVTYYGLDWPVSLHFVQLGPDEKTFEWFNVGIELGEFKAVPGEPAKMPRRRFDPKFIRLVADSCGTRARSPPRAGRRSARVTEKKAAEDPGRARTETSTSMAGRRPNGSQGDDRRAQGQSPFAGQGAGQGLWRQRRHRLPLDRSRRPRLAGHQGAEKVGWLALLFET